MPWIFHKFFNILEVWMCEATVADKIHDFRTIQYHWSFDTHEWDISPFEMIDFAQMWSPSHLNAKLYLSKVAGELSLDFRITLQAGWKPCSTSDHSLLITFYTVTCDVSSVVSCCVIRVNFNLYRTIRFSLQWYC